MSAKEMFEELGYIQVDTSKNGYGALIEYERDETYIDDYESQIEYGTLNTIYFYKNKTYRIEMQSDDDNEELINMKLHKAINKQIEELGWE